MRALVFARRNGKELLRDPVNLFFGLAFPLVLLLLFSLINSAIPPEAQNTMFEPAQSAPGVAMFGTVFMALFSGMILAKDRTTSFLLRLFASPMRPRDFIAGYTLPLLLFAAAQAAVTLTAAVFLGMPLSWGLPLAVLMLVPIMFFFIGVGLLCGTFLNEKAVGGICGALLTNLAAWLSGVWVPVDLIGGAFRTVSRALPFYHAAEMARMAAAGNLSGVLPHAANVLAYAVVVYVLAAAAFRGMMRSDKK